MSNDDALEDARNALAGETERVATWADFSSGKSIFDNLLDIRRFSLELALGPTPELNNPEVASKVATGLYSVALRAIQDAKFFQQEMLSVRSDPGQAGVFYNDDRFDFAIQASYAPEESGAGTLTIQRSGSRMKDFHDWFTAMVLQIPPMIEGALVQIQQGTGREVKAFRGLVTFEFLLHDLASGERRRAIRNTDVIARLVRGVPGDDGTLSEDQAVMASAGRIDVNLSRWIKSGDVFLLERYIVEAPANKNGAGLWLRFSQSSETYTESSPDGIQPDKRYPFELSKFLGTIGRSYSEFLSEKALGRFVTTLTSGITFKSSSGGLP